MKVDTSLGWDIALGIQVFILAATALFVYQVLWGTKKTPEYRSVAILVLGDIGRSPRMMYHAQSFAGNNFQTYIIAYQGSQPLPSLLEMSHVRFLYIPEPPKFISRLPRVLFLLFAPLKVVHQIWSVLRAFFFQIPHPPQYILVQNPPTIPSLAIVWLVARFRGSKVIIDWHNLGYTILAMRLGEKSKIVSLARKFEMLFGRKAYAHLFVTNAMKQFLCKNWDLQGKKIVLHDRPPSHFHQCSPSEIHDLFVRLMPEIDTDLSFFPDYNLPTTTPITKVGKLSSSYGDYTSLSPRMMPFLRHDRPALLVTSTSWTPDEDFSMLVDALSRYEARKRTYDINGGKKLPKILMFVTGKGPLRAKYMRELERLKKEEAWESVKVMSIWLEPEDYPRLLGSCDLGISLHSSSSALDLPMKIVDMFGCNLPVCALNFSCLHELVQDRGNGLVFEDGKGLSAHLETLLSNFPDSELLAELRSGIANPAWIRSPSDGTPPASTNAEPWRSWEQNWDDKVKPLVMAQVSQAMEEWLQNFANSNVDRLAGNVVHGSTG